jgi:diguanylate cyclase (GGDEF)-like protein
MSDGLAMFDHSGHLVFCNVQYLAFFPLTAHVRVPGAHIRDILRTAIERGEFVNVPRGEEQSWIEASTAALFVNNDQDLKTADGRWLSIRTRIARDGSSLVVVTDMTALKESELALMDLTVQLRAMAETDGLTGLANRRAFDYALHGAIRDAFGTSRPLSLILIDIDHFKAYNDRHGHGAGDRCLRIFSECLNQVKTRPRDLVARYGGEEFVVILPNTDAAGAIVVGRRIRELLHQRAEPHSASEKGILTASMGVTTWQASGKVIESADLLDQADKALYRAKLGGRDCLEAWADSTSEGTRTCAA